ncbi:MAG: purine-nucleoside phosphorylase [bacterium]
MEYLDIENYLDQIQRAANYLQSKKFENIDVVVILGSGLNDIAESFEKIQQVSYGEIPGFSLTTVEGHKGKLTLCSYLSFRILFMQGRFHFYEGYPMHRVVFPIRVFDYMGVKNLIVTNASGGINPTFRVGDVMIIKDHISLFMSENPLRGPNLSDFGPRFLSMQNAYDQEWIIRIKQKMPNDERIKEGVYCMVPGPTYETPAELRMLKLLGVDAVGMSTVPEVITARHGGIRVVGFSVITDIAEEVVKHGVTHQEVLENTKKAAELVKSLINISIETMYA